MNNMKALRVEHNRTEIQDWSQGLPPMTPIAPESFAYSVSHDLRTPLATVERLSRVLQQDYGISLQTRRSAMWSSFGVAHSR